MVCSRPPLILTFDRLTLKLVCESHLRLGTFLPNFGTLGLWILELFAMYGQTDGQKQHLLPYGWGIAGYRQSEINQSNAEYT